jgi:hypothetical protein
MLQLHTVQHRFAILEHVSEPVAVAVLILTVLESRLAFAANEDVDSSTTHSR